MTTKEKVVSMMRKAAAARRLSDKVMAKRAEYRSMPSEAYMAGFAKAAESYGVDPVELMKAAGMWDSIKGGVQQFGQNVLNGAKAVGNAAMQGVKGVGNAAMQMGKGVANGAKQIGQGNFSQGFQTMGQGALNGMKTYGQTFVNGARNMGNMAMQGAQALGNAAGKFGNGFTGGARVGRGISGTAGGLIRLGSGIVGGIRGMMN